jgi:hypothetical protein
MRVLILAAAGCLVLVVSPVPASGQTDPPVIPIRTVAPPPQWGLMQRHVLDQLEPAALEFCGSILVTITD